MFKWDVIVVGAGPAGSSAAYGLARQGLRVLMLEKARIPRYKPCGGGLSLKVRSALDYDFSSAVQDTIRQVSIAYGRERIRIESAEAYCVMRADFDALLAAQAVRAGAELRDACPVDGITLENDRAGVSAGGERLDAALLIGADGVNGGVRRAAGFPPHHRMGVAIEAELQVPSAALAEWRSVLHMDYGALSWGYGWIFPKADHLSVGVGALIRPGHKLDLQRELARYLSSEPSLSGAKPILTRGHRVPLGGQFAIYHRPHALLVGDAAGLADPFTAEGIYFAIRSGQIAAQEIGRARQRGDNDLSPYSRRINSEINADFRFGWWLTQVFYRMPRFSFRVFAHSASTQDGAKQLANGTLTYKRLLLRVAGNSLPSLVPR